jgi:hypothetical protein
VVGFGEKDEAYSVGPGKKDEVMIGRLKFEFATVINDKLDRLPLETWSDPSITIADLSMGGGQYLVEVIKRLRKYHTDKHIETHVFGFESSLLRLGYAINTHELKGLGTFKVMKIEEMMQMTQRFNVIVGNPPFQQNSNKAKNTSTNKLWTKFIVLATTLCVKGGHIAYITPQTWMMPNKAFKIMIAKQLVYVNTKIGEYFPGVGNSFSAWVMKNLPGNGIVEVDGQVFNASALGLIPLDRSKEGVSIITKVLSATSKLKFLRTCKHHTQEIKKSDLFGEKSSEYRYKILYTHNVTFWSREPSLTQNMKKVVVFRNGYLSPTYDSANGTAQDTFYKEVKNKEEGKNLVGILDSRLFTYVLSRGVTKTCNYFSPTVLKQLPHLDYTRSWTDAEIYEHFGITKKEQAHIDAFLG